jgi:sugar lactone lactonase YvrE
VARSSVAEPESFNFADGFDGNLALDSLGRLYVTAGRAGCIYRVGRDGRVDTFLNGLMNPTGIAFGPDGTLFVLEAGRSRVLRVVALDKAERTSSATALS